MLLTFIKGTEITVIRINGRHLYFNQMVRGVPMMSTIEGLKLNPATIVKEFPDLEGKPLNEIRREAIRRFKERIEKMNSEAEIMDYLRMDLEKHGYKLIMMQRQGFRPVRVR